MSTTQDVNPSALWARVILEELLAAGVRHVCISPGSRSTPLTLAAANHESFQVHNHIDERSAAFFALGLAKQSGRPVALICTSGSAGAHYLPAVIEADMARLPLVALTADRPIELMDTGAGQTIDQKDLFGRHARASIHLEDPQMAPQVIRRLRTTLQRAMSRAVGQVGAMSPPGPIQINVPFREPLEPTPVALPEGLYHAEDNGVFARAEGSPWVQREWSVGHVRPEVIEALARRCATTTRGVIVCGPLEPTQGDLSAVIAALGEATGFVVMADPLSSARYGQQHSLMIPTYDALLRAKRWAGSVEAAPEMIVRFGAQPTSKAYRIWREQHASCHEVAIDPFGEVLDQVQQTAQLLVAAPEQVATQLVEALGALKKNDDDEVLREDRGAWQRRWREADAMARATIEQALSEQGEGPWEGPIARELVHTLREEDLFFVASSMPIRDVDAFALRREAPLQVFANRGANGIDGLIATAAGVSSASGARCVLLIGDVAMLHDASSLLTAVRGVSDEAPVRLEIVMVNNAGGGIFSYLPIAQHAAHFERHFITPHQVNFGALCEAYGVAYEKVTKKSEWRELLDRLAQQAPQGAYVRVSEVVVDREDNVARHRAMWGAITRALETAEQES